MLSHISRKWRFAKILTIKGASSPWKIDIKKFMTSEWQNFLELDVQPKEEEVSQTPAAKEFFGSSPFPSSQMWKMEHSVLLGPKLSCPCSISEKSSRRLFGSKANKNAEKKQGTATIKSSWRSTRKSLLPELKACSALIAMGNSPVPKLPLRTVVKKTPELETPLNLESSQFVETLPLIGSPYGPPPSPEILKTYLHQSEYRIIMPCGPSAPIMLSVQHLKEQFMSFGEVLVLANQDVLGMKRELAVTLKIPNQSFGTATVVKKMLLSMNFEEQLMWRTSSDGLIVTQSLWSLKGHPAPYWQLVSGSPVTSIPVCGIRI
nr:MAG: replication associated protein [Cressdnaviricota sp.]